MKIGDVQLALDVYEYLLTQANIEQVEQTNRGWVVALCPFHSERNSSFAVSTETGRYVCKACGATGSFPRLIQHLNGMDSEYQAEALLIASFGRFVPDVAKPLVLDFHDKAEPIVTYRPIASDWLERVRGIDKAVQDVYSVGIDYKSHAVTFPWYAPDGRLVTVKYRSTVDKFFWYEPNTKELTNLLFGYDVASWDTKVVVVEGEVDALSVYQAGVPAVALGGSNLSENQARLLRNARASEIVLFTDNDPAGVKARKAIEKALLGYKIVKYVSFDSVPNCKDANDILRLHGPNRVRELIETSRQSILPLLF